MIVRLTGVLESVDGLEATLLPPGSPLAYQVMVPGYLAERLGTQLGREVTLHTIHLLEGQLGGSTLVPRLIGFATPHERRFFELMTTVEGLGTKRALKALAKDPAQIARAIAGADAAWLTGLPEIGKKTAEKVILELKGKVGAYLSPDEVAGLDRQAAVAADPAATGHAPLVEDAIAALMALGESRADAERKVKLAATRRPGARSAEELVAAVYGG